MILLLHNRSSKRICNFAKAKEILNQHNISLCTELIEFPNAGEQFIISVYILLMAKRATKILFHVQPSIFDISDPYYDYLPYIYALIGSHPSIKRKFYFIHPFYLPSAFEFKQAINDKLILGDFKEIPPRFPYYSKPVPIVAEKVVELHLTVLEFCLE